ncbi:MAG TPA: tetratricopeptide repeat protein [Solirubrobacteraceae bacterium]|nr:tetratricopeptide repeat protein [Solirubrobacteraceae bacterium]
MGHFGSGVDDRRIELIATAAPDQAQRPKMRIHLILGAAHCYRSMVGRVEGMQLQSRRDRHVMRQPETAALDQSLATLLSVLSARLAKAGRCDQALANIERAVDIRRRLAGADSQVDAADMARTLNALAVRLAQAGRIGDSLAASEQAVHVYQRLAAADPAIYEPELAPVLNNLSIRLAAAGRRAEALAASAQVLDIHGRLATTDPAAFDPQLWISLNNYADRLTDSGYDEDARAIRAEAATRRSLHQRRLAEATLLPE